MGWHFWIAGQAVPWSGVALLGIVVGYVAGMFGVGGGFLMTPLLVAVFGVPLEIAVGTGLCQMVGTSMVASLRHKKARQGELRFDLLMVPGSLLGVELGARTLTALGNAGELTLGGRAIPWVSVVVQPAYALLLLYVAVSYWRHGLKRDAALDEVRPGRLARLRFGPTIALPAIGLEAVSAPLIAYLGLCLGFASGLLGIGGGVALNPILIYGFGFPIRQAVGTGIVVLFATALVGTAAHAARGHVHLGMAVAMLVGATVSAQLGALASRKLSGAALARIHALVIFAAIAGVLWDLLRRFR